MSLDWRLELTTFIHSLNHSTILAITTPKATDGRTFNIVKLRSDALRLTLTSYDFKQFDAGFLSYPSKKCVAPGQLDAWLKDIEWALAL